MRTGDVFNPFKLFHGAIIPSSLLAETGLSRGAKELYGQLRRYAGARGHCWPGQAVLAGDFGVTVRTISRWISQLTKGGFIRVEQRGLGRSASYVFVWNEKLKPVQDSLRISTSEENKPIARSKKAIATTELSQLTTTELSQPIEEEKGHRKRVTSFRADDLAKLGAVVSQYGVEGTAQIVERLAKRAARLGKSPLWAADVLQRKWLYVKSRKGLYPTSAGWFFAVLDQAADPVQAVPKPIVSHDRACESPIRKPPRSEVEEVQSLKIAISNLAMRRRL